MNKTLFVVNYYLKHLTKHKLYLLFLLAITILLATGITYLAHQTIGSQASYLLTDLGKQASENLPNEIKKSTDDFRLDSPNTYTDVKKFLANELFIEKELSTVSHELARQFSLTLFPPIYQATGTMLVHFTHTLILTLLLIICVCWLPTFPALFGNSYPLQKEVWQTYYAKGLKSSHHITGKIIAINLIQLFLVIMALVSMMITDSTITKSMPNLASIPSSLILFFFLLLVLGTSCYVIIFQFIQQVFTNPITSPLIAIMLTPLLLFMITITPYLIHAKDASIQLVQSEVKKIKIERPEVIKTEYHTEKQLYLRSQIFAKSILENISPLLKKIYSSKEKHDLKSIFSCLIVLYLLVSAILYFISLFIANRSKI